MTETSIFTRQKLYKSMLNDLKLQNTYLFGIIGFVEKIIINIKFNGYIPLDYLELNNKIYEKFKELLQIHGIENISNKVIKLNNKIQEEQKKNNFEYVNVSML
jgi:hypothetical protein